MVVAFTQFSGMNLIPALKDEQNKSSFRNPTGFHFPHMIFGLFSGLATINMDSCFTYICRAYLVM